MNGIVLERWPDLPQSPRLAAVVADLWADPDVVAVWLGGSFARGEADQHSDVDLRVALVPEAYDPDRIPESAGVLMAAAVTRLQFSFSRDSTLWHMLLDDGVIYDLHLQPASAEPPREVRLVLACRDASLAEKLAAGDDLPLDFPPALPADVQRALQFFWMSQQKQQKVLYRDLPLLAWQGECLMRQDLVRFHYILATGQDCGPLSRLTIHTLTPVIRTVQAQAGDDILTVVGAPARTSREIIAATARLRDEVAGVGRLLAEKLGFDYPAAAEETVRRTWQRFVTDTTERAFDVNRIV